jgi:hypothetical protein
MAKLVRVGVNTGTLTEAPKQYLYASRRHRATRTVSPAFGGQEKRALL